MQRYTIFFITVNALHVSGGFSAHRQELETVHTSYITLQEYINDARPHERQIVYLLWKSSIIFNYKQSIGFNTFVFPDSVLRMYAVGISMRVR